ncbi:MAG TPA: hypothetical protein V6C52_13325 [Coleofasciculaceae cyanobacterium]
MAITLGKAGWIQLYDETASIVAGTCSEDQSLRVGIDHFLHTAVQAVFTPFAGALP